MNWRTLADSLIALYLCVRVLIHLSGYWTITPDEMAGWVLLTAAFVVARRE